MAHFHRSVCLIVEHLKSLIKTPAHTHSGCFQVETKTIAEETGPQIHLKFNEVVSCLGSFNHLLEQTFANGIGFDDISLMLIMYFDFDQLAAVCL